MTAILTVRNLRKRFPGVVAVDGVSFDVREGACFGLLGPNGAGKTTTVEMLQGVRRHSEGEILFRGGPRGKAFRESVGIQFQSTALQDYLSVEETLRLFRRLYSRGADVEDLIGLCALEELRDRDNRKLSGGQRQRLLLAMALVNDPELLFLDEPTTGLDPQARRNFWDLLTRIRERRITVILTTHYMEEAYRLCDEIAIMDHGRFIAHGTPGDLLAEHFDDVILEIPGQDYTPSGNAEPFRVLRAGDPMELAAPDVNEAIRYLMDRDVPLDRLVVRQRTLEDLFLELTGRELRA